MVARSSSKNSSQAKVHKAGLPGKSRILPSHWFSTWWDLRMNAEKEIKGLCFAALAGIASVAAPPARGWDAAAR